MKRLSLLSVVAIVAFASCKKDSTSTPVTIVTGTKTIAANFSTASTSKYTLFRFSDSSIVPQSDSASNKWDFGIRQATIIVNSYSGGPGAAGVVLTNGTLDAITTAPSTGYAYDTTASQKAVKANSWYSYNSTTNGFVPTAGKVFIFKTGDGGHYAKMEMLTAEYVPFAPSPVPTTILYKFRFAYQANGTTTF